MQHVLHGGAAVEPNSSSALQLFQINKAFQEIDVKNSEYGNQMLDFRIIGELGRGSYGTVFKVQSLKNNQTVVLKKISLKHMKPKQQQAALKEVQILKFLDHSHIIRYFTSFMEDESIHIVMEYAEKGDLYKLLKDQRARRKYFSEKDIWDFSYQICMAVDYLHSKNIIHRDIKCLNIFLTEDKSIKLGDLGVSKIVSNAAALQDTRVGTPLYLSPELVKQQPYDFKVDIWAIGCAIYHLACLEPPFQGDNLITLGNNIVNKKHKSLPQIYSSKLSSFIDKFLSKKPSERPTAKEAVSLIPSFVKNAYQDTIMRKNLLTSLQAQETQFSNQESTSANTMQERLKSTSPTKDFRFPAKKQIEEQSLINIKRPSIELQKIKIENNVQLVQIQKTVSQTNESRKDQISISQNIQQNEGVLNLPTQNTNSKINFYNPVQDKISHNKQNSDLIQLIRNRPEEQLFNYRSETKKTPNESYSKLNPTSLNQNIGNVISKSQSQEKLSTSKLSTQNQIFQQKNSQNNFASNEWFSKQQIILAQANGLAQGEFKDKKLPLKDQNSKLSSQVNIKNTSQNKSQGVQFKIDNQIIQSDGDQIDSDNLQKEQQNQNLNEDVDQLKQRKILNQLGREMPYLARPQTASASNNHFFKKSQNQQQTSQTNINHKPGISMLRGSNADRNSQENLLDQMQNNAGYRPFSAAVPSIQGINQRKKIVAFEDELNKMDQSDLQILNDDEPNENDYEEKDQFVKFGAQAKRHTIFNNAGGICKPLTGMSNRPITAQSRG